ncbi:MAG TPA: hypothetical protein VH023_00685 [Rhodopila sp.]|jgi:hypothetical protein|nr:hypothetical protein [Rhodopila sp.]
MRRKPHPPTRRDIPPPAVPTFQPDLKTVPETPTKPEDDAADEAVRRMVEAAYT